MKKNPKKVLPATRKARSQSRPKTETREDLIKILFEFFYPVHYKAGAVLEATLSRGLLTRKQFAVLWIIHSFGDGQGALPRKRLEIELAHSLELESPAVSKVLRELSEPPLELVSVRASENSAREKVVRLTAKGARFLEESNQTGIQHLTQMLTGMSLTTMRNGIPYLAEIARRFDALRDTEAD